MLGSCSVRMTGMKGLGSEEIAVARVTTVVEYQEKSPPGFGGL
jgi:hypothetical protein